jgi:hypothetical protein
VHARILAGTPAAQLLAPLGGEPQHRQPAALDVPFLGRRAELGGEQMTAMTALPPEAARIRLLDSVAAVTDSPRAGTAHTRRRGRLPRGWMSSFASDSFARRQR